MPPCDAQRHSTSYRAIRCKPFQEVASTDFSFPCFAFCCFNFGNNPSIRKLRAPVPSSVFSILCVLLVCRSCSQMSSRARRLACRVLSLGPSQPRETSMFLKYAEGHASSYSTCMPPPTVCVYILTPTLCVHYPRGCKVPWLVVCAEDELNAAQVRMHNLTRGC